MARRQDAGSLNHAAETAEGPIAGPMDASVGDVLPQASLTDYLETVEAASLSAVARAVTQMVGLRSLSFRPVLAVFLLAVRALAHNPYSFTQPGQTHLCPRRWWESGF